MKKNTVITIVIAVLLCLVLLGMNPLSVNADGEEWQAQLDDHFDPVYVWFTYPSGSSTKYGLEKDTTIGMENFPDPKPAGEPDIEGKEWYWADANGVKFEANTPVASDMEVTSVSKQEVKVTFIAYSGNVIVEKKLYAGGKIEELPSVEPDNASSFVPGKEWYWADEKGVKFEADTPVTSDMTVRAVWSQDVSFGGIQYPITMTVHSFSQPGETFPEYEDPDRGKAGWVAEENGTVYEAGTSLIQADGGDIPANRFTP